jgi:hypothetical protein
LFDVQPTRWLVSIYKSTEEPGMKSTLKHIAAAAMLAAMGAAQASGVTIQPGDFYDGLMFSGAASLTFSSDTLAAFDTMKAAIAPYGAATTSPALDTDGYWLSAATSAPLTSLTVDGPGNTLLGATTTGGVTLTTPLIRDVTHNGSLTITDLNVDLVNKLVYGTISGNNLAPTTEALWTIGSITGDTTLNGYGIYTTKLAGLHLTTAGLNDFSTALTLWSLGKTTLGAVSSFGTIELTVRNTVLNDGPGILPEPSSYALMGLGLVGVAFAAKRSQLRPGQNLGRVASTL